MESGHLYFATPMIGKGKSKEENRYYLLPGMGKLNRQKRRKFQLIALLVGIVTSAILCALFYVTSR